MCGKLKQGNEAAWVADWRDIRRPALHYPAAVCGGGAGAGGKPARLTRGPSFQPACVSVSVSVGLKRLRHMDAAVRFEPMAIASIDRSIDRSTMHSCSWAHQQEGPGARRRRQEQQHGQQQGRYLPSPGRWSPHAPPPPRRGSGAWPLLPPKQHAQSHQTEARAWGSRDRDDDLLHGCVRVVGVRAARSMCGH